VLVAAGVAALLAAVPARAFAQQPLPVGESKGVRAERVHGQITLTFTKRASHIYRRVAGRLVIVTCTNVPGNKGIRGDTVTTGGDTNVRIPKGRRRVATGEGSKPLDYCLLSLPARKITRKGRHLRLPRRVLVSIPLTQAGAVLLDEQSKAASIAGVLFLAQLLAEKRKIDTWPTPEQLAAYVRKLSPKGARGFGARGFTPLASATVTPAAGKVGYWSDGRENVAVAMLSRAGRRLFLQIGADHFLSTNLTNYLFADEPGLLFARAISTQPRGGA
jgi:hypothetical protein